jgi:glyoxylate reductase
MAKLNYKVMVVGQLPGEALHVLSEQANVVIISDERAARERELIDCLVDCDALVSLYTTRVSELALQAAKNLKMVANVAVGYDNIDVGYASKKGVLVTNTPGVLDNTTADLAFGLLLAAARRIPEADTFVRQGKWQRFSMDLMLGADVHGKTLGIIGMGRIGQAMGRRARGFDMKVIYHSRARLPASVEAELGVSYVSKKELLQVSDFISLHAPSNSETFHFIGQKELDLVKSNCILVNTARGDLIDEVALIKALKAKQLQAAALDVFEREPKVATELINMHQVVLTPHIGSASMETRTRMANMAVEGVFSAFSGVMPPNTVNKQIWPQFQMRLKEIADR